MNYDVVVIGAGASGLMAAARAGECGARVLLIERNHTPGRKLLLCGKGRCNFTNAGELDTFLENYPNNPLFLRNGLHRFGNRELIALLERLGLEVKEERGGRYFPKSDRAYDVLEALLRYGRESGNVELRGSSPVKRGEKTPEGWLVRAGRETVQAPCLVLATGGLSYPATGSTGDGFYFLRDLGLPMVEPAAALVPLETEGDLAKRLQGLSLKHVTATLWSDGEKGPSEFGEMLFTHFGLSGPIILSLSGRAVRLLQAGRRVEVVINLKPALSRETIDARLLREFADGKKAFKSILKNLLPSKMAGLFPELAGIPAEKKAAEITAVERRRLIDRLTDLRFVVTKPRPIAEAIVTQGGLDVKAVDPRTMEVKSQPGLFVVGELLDVDGLTGGFNLQAAFTTGYLAGEAAAKKTKVERREGREEGKRG